MSTYTQRCRAVRFPTDLDPFAIEPVAFRGEVRPGSRPFGWGTVEEIWGDYVGIVLAALDEAVPAERRGSRGAGAKPANTEVALRPGAS